MAKGSRGRRRIASRQCRPSPYPLPRRDRSHEKPCSKMHVKSDWVDATCSVCMEYPHSAVLLLCSSHEKGCRPYMCGTSYRYSNCLDQYRKAYTKETDGGDSDRPTMLPLNSWSVGKCEANELACPLCRGQVKGWTIVEPAREYLNAKKRTCMQEGCSFVGNFKEMRKHVRADHPSAKPREVDPNLEQKWRVLERERERQDVLSTITSSMPGAVVFGDYVIEGNNYGFMSDGDDDDDDDGAFNDDQHEASGIEGRLLLFLLHNFNQPGTITTSRGGSVRLGRNPFHPSEGGAIVSGRASPIERFGYNVTDEDSDDDGEDAVNDRAGEHPSLVGRLRNQGRVVFGRSGRRRRQREDNRGRR